jgi:hypothetical protein
MSMTLILWKAPVVREPEDAEALLKPFYEREDDSAFEPSPAIAAVADELRRIYPWRDLSNDETVARMSEEERAAYSPDDLTALRDVGGGGPWADLPFCQTERLLLLDIKWGADDKVLDDIMRLARQHRLVLYDPQGPDVHLPDDPEEPGPLPRTTPWQWVKTVGGAALLVALTYAAWQIPIGWIRWPVVIVTGFVALAGLFVLYLMIAGALGLIKDEE